MGALHLIRLVAGGAGFAANIWSVTSYGLVCVWRPEQNRPDRQTESGPYGICGAKAAVSAHG